MKIRETSLAGFAQLSKPKARNDERRTPADGVDLWRSAKTVIGGTLYGLVPGLNATIAPIKASAVAAESSGSVLTGLGVGVTAAMAGLMATIGLGALLLGDLSGLPLWLGGAVGVGLTYGATDAAASLSL